MKIKMRHVTVKTPTSMQSNIADNTLATMTYNWSLSELENNEGGICEGAGWLFSLSEIVPGCMLCSSEGELVGLG